MSRCFGTPERDGWVRRWVRLAVADRPRGVFVLALVRGPLAVHRVVGWPFWWSVTHVDTGLGLGASFGSIERAVAYADDMQQFEWREAGAAFNQPQKPEWFASAKLVRAAHLRAERRELSPEVR
jgi:hypothetical protein